MSKSVFKSETVCDYVEEGECTGAKQLGRTVHCTGNRPEGCGVYYKMKKGTALV